MDTHARTCTHTYHDVSLMTGNTTDFGTALLLQGQCYTEGTQYNIVQGRETEDNTAAAVSLKGAEQITVLQ